jgi:hypothetical protein
VKKIERYPRTLTHTEPDGNSTDARYSNAGIPGAVFPKRLPTSSAKPTRKTKTQNKEISGINRQEKGENRQKSKCSKLSSKIEEKYHQEQYHPSMTE